MSCQKELIEAEAKYAEVMNKVENDIRFIQAKISHHRSLQELEKMRAILNNEFGFWKAWADLAIARERFISNQVPHRSE